MSNLMGVFMKTLALLSFLLFSLSHGQKAVLPFASEGNILELSVKNGSSAVITAVAVEATDIPAWITFKQRQKLIASLAGDSQEMALFTFSVDRKAPVGSDEKIGFLISTPQGRSWKMELTVSVAPPEKFELFQNYPNPFNATTAISYQLSAVSRVRLNVYNLIGQNVKSVFLGEKGAGYYQETWDASSLSSGIYVYELTASDAANKQIISRKRMTVVK